VHRDVSADADVAAAVAEREAEDGGENDVEEDGGKAACNHVEGKGGEGKAGGVWGDVDVEAGDGEDGYGDNDDGDVDGDDDVVGDVDGDGGVGEGGGDAEDVVAERKTDDAVGKRVRDAGANDTGGSVAGETSAASAWTATRESTASSRRVSATAPRIRAEKDSLARRSRAAMDTFVRNNNSSSLYL